MPVAIGKCVAQLLELPNGCDTLLVDIAHDGRSADCGARSGAYAANLCGAAMWPTVRSTARALACLPFGELLVKTATAGPSASKSCHSHLARDIETRPLAFLHAIDGTEGALDDR
jgi:hypothetical protein